MEKSILTTLLIVLSVATNLLAQNGQYATSTIAPELLVDANAVIRNQQTRLEITSVDKAIYHYKRVVTLFNEKSRANELRVFYDSFRKVGKIRGKMYDASGKVIRDLAKSEIKDYSHYEKDAIYDDRIKYAKMNHNSYPYTIEYEYKVTYNKHMFYPDWSIQNFSASVEKSSLEVIAYDADQLSYKSINTNLEPKISNEKNQTIYYWEILNQPAIKKEALAPSSDEILPMVLLTPKSFTLGVYKGDSKSWNSFGAFMHRLNLGRDKLPKAMKNEVQSLVADAKTDREKIDILYKYLQKNTRYVSVQLGVGGWQTFDASYVNKNKYGDCKALTNYMQSMLKEVGITSYPVLIKNGEPDYLVLDDFVSPQFNHVILSIPSEDYWLECTSSSKPPNFLGSSNENRKVLRYSEKGGEIVKTPDYKAEVNQEKNKAVFTLTETGDAHLKNEILFTGTQQESLRELQRETTKEKQEELFIENENLPSLSLNTFEIEVSENKPEVTLTLDADVRKYASKGGKRLFVPLNIINPATYVPPSLEKRQYPILLKSDILDEDEIVFNLPEGYEVESMPEPKFSLETDFGSYQVQIEQEEKKITYTRQLKLTPGQYPAERYEEYRNFRKEIASRDSTKLVLVKKKPRP